MFLDQVYNLSICYMNRQQGEQIGSSLGKVREVEVDTDNKGWSSYLRIRVELDLSKSLIRGKYI